MEVALLSSMMNAIPFVGQVKAGVHYLAGDYDGAKRACYESTRSTAVLTGGVLGGLLGPVVGVQGAFAAGTMVDSMASVGAGESRGIWRQVSNISEDLSHGRYAAGLWGTLKTAGHIGVDCFGGFGMGVISSSFVKGAGKAVGKEIIKTSAEAAALMALDYGMMYGLAGDGSKASGSGSQPPRRNPNGRPRQPGLSDEVTQFLELLRKWVTHFPEVRDKVLEIFENLKDYQWEHLRKTVEAVSRNGSILEETVLLTLQMHDRHLIGDTINFMNFMDLMQFVSAVINDKMEESPAEAVEFWTYLSYVFSDIENQSVVEEVTTAEYSRALREINDDISSRGAISPYFRDVEYSAVYHYLKHRIKPGTENEKITVAEYHDLIRRALTEIRQYRQFGEFNRGTLVCERYFSEFNRRVRLVLKFQGRKLALASCFIVESIHKGDRDGDEWIFRSPRR